MKKGILFVLSGPSGVGKGAVCTTLRSKLPELVYSVSATTRSPREGEVEGRNYFFKTHAQFCKMIQTNDLLEYTEYVGNYYGTPREFVEKTLAAGKDIILEIEVQGALQIKQKFNEGVFIFLVPPSLQILKQRIKNRGTESTATINNRLNIASTEMNLLHHYDYVVINDKIEGACERIQSILQAEHCKRERFVGELLEQFKST